MTDKYPTINADTSIGRKVLTADATPDEAKLAAIGVQFENGHVSRENVCWLLNQCEKLSSRLWEAQHTLIEAGFACMTAEEIVKATETTPEERAAQAAIVKGVFAKAYAEVMGRKEKR